MALPGDIPLITVTGQWEDLMNGGYCSGKVVFSPNALTRMVDIASSIAIMPNKKTAILNATGQISVQLAATDTPALSGTPFLYTVAVILSDSTGTPLGPYTFQLPLPAAGPGTVSITTPQYAVNGASVTLPGN